jgi:ribosomal-protein-alanine N-acetyltransferase
LSVSNIIKNFMCSQPILETERLTLRPFQLSDAEQVEKLAGDKQVASTTLNVPHPYPEGGAEEWIATHESKYLEGKGVAYAITLKNSGELIGCISLAILVEHNQAELGYWVGVPYWNKGFCTEAGRTILEYGFKTMGLNRIHASYLIRNPASGRVMEKLGMLHEGTLRQHVLKWGVYEDLGLKGILRKDWKKLRAQ